MKKPTLKERFTYWFDNRMAKGSVGLISVLILFTIIVVLLLSGVIMLFDAGNEQSLSGVLWDSFATIINAWMPSFEEGSPVYLIAMALTAIGGLLVTSVLIGIVASTIEEKIIGLRKGNSIVIEKDHIVVIGFYTGEYTLLRQLILAAGDRPSVIVIGSEMERDELEQQIKDNVEIPKNIRIICRTVDVYDPASLQRLAIQTCRNAIISPTDDSNTVKMLLAVSSLIQSSKVKNVRVNAIISREEHRFPPTISKKHNVSTLQSNDTLAKIIAHSCTQSGLSKVFTEIFNFEGSELYLNRISEITGMTFSELMYRMDKAVPVGIYRNHTIMMNPPAETVIEESDRILVFAEEKDSAILVDEGSVLPDDYELRPVKPERDTKVLVFGYNRTLKTVLRELPENVQKVTLVNYPGTDREVIEKICREKEMELECVSGDTRSEMGLLELSRNAEHVIVLSRHDQEEDQADMFAIFLLLNLRDIRIRYHLRYNITAEMRREKNQSLVVSDDHTDFVVASNMASLFLAQLAESPQLSGAFEEILSNEGNELFMKQASHINCAGTHTVSELRQIAFRQGYIFLGYLSTDFEYVFNPSLNETLNINNRDSIIVFGEN